jgi:hypothetical protein
MILNLKTESTSILPRQGTVPESVIFLNLKKGSTSNLARGRPIPESVIFLNLKMESTSNLARRGRIKKRKAEALTKVNIFGLGRCWRLAAAELLIGQAVKS